MCVVQRAVLGVKNMIRETYPPRGDRQEYQVLKCPYMACSCKGLSWAGGTKKSLQISHQWLPRGDNAKAESLKTKKT